MTKQTMDRPVTPGTDIDPPRANCGCPTYWSIDETMEIQIWEAKHEFGCLRIPVRRREAVMATRKNYA